MAETIYIRGEAGTVFALDLPLHEAIEDRLRKGYLTRVNADGSAYDGVDDSVPADLGAEPVEPTPTLVPGEPVEPAPALVPGLPTQEPDVAAEKIEWVGWAVANGCTPDVAEAMTLADLIDQFGTK